MLPDEVPCYCTAILSAVHPRRPSKIALTACSHLLLPSMRILSTLFASSWSAHIGNSNAECYAAVAKRRTPSLTVHEAPFPRAPISRHAPVGDHNSRAALLRAERERAPSAACAQHHDAAAGQRALAAHACLHRVQRR